MKEFFKNVFASILGMALFFAIFGFFGFISIVGMITSGSSSVKVSDNSVFVLKLNGVVEERASEDISSSIGLLFGKDMGKVGLDDILASIAKARDNKDIKGIYIETGDATFDSPATIQRIRKALVDFKESGKWIVAYGDNYEQGSYWLASIADEMYMSPTGMINLRGVGVKEEFYAGLYDKLGVKIFAPRVGKYKSYPEPYIRKDMSPENREQRMAYFQGVWNNMLKDISASRKVSVESLNQMVNDSVMAFAVQQDYVKAKLIDKLLYEDEIKGVVKKKLALGEDDNIVQLTLSDMINLKSSMKENGEKIAVYYAVGGITDTDQSGLTGEACIVGSTMSADLHKLAEDDDVKAVVIRVNSGGGSSVASEQIWHAMEQLKGKKPVVVSMGGVAASGGYMISAGANCIFAEPTTLTGSIGVVGLVKNYNGLFTDKLGVTFDDITTNTYTNWIEDLIYAKDNVNEQKFMQGYVNRDYDRFLAIVADGRKMRKEQVHEVAQGRIWLATDALRIKLIDQIGSLDDAVKKAAQLAKLDEYHTAAYPAQSSWIEQLMKKKEKTTYLDNELKAILGDQYEAWVFLRTINKRNMLQARLPFSTKMK